MQSVPAKAYFTLEDPVVPMYHPRALWQLALAQGAPPDKLLQGTGLTPDIFDNPRARLSYLQFGQLSRNALTLTGNPALGLDFGHQIHLGNLGVLGLALLSSPTARQANEIALAYTKVVAPGVALSMRTEGDLSITTIRPTVPMGDLHCFAVESILMGIVEVATFLAKGAGIPELDVIELRVDYEKPEYAERYAELTHAPIVYGCSAIEIVYPDAALDRPMGCADPLTADEARRLCEYELSQLPGTGLLEQVRALLAKRPGEYMNLEELASALGTSSRSLRRALSRLGSSYQILLFEVRKEHALDHIRSPHLSVEGLAQKLGFSDARAFRRAFKRWTGYTPSDYRDAVRRGETPKILAQPRKPRSSMVVPSGSNSEEEASVSSLSWAATSPHDTAQSIAG